MAPRLPALAGGLGALVLTLALAGCSGGNPSGTAGPGGPAPAASPAASGAPPASPVAVAPTAATSPAPAAASPAPAAASPTAAAPAATAPTAAASPSPVVGVGGAGGSSTGTGGVPAQAATIPVSADDFAFDPKDLDARTGAITFEVKNTGQVEHNFVIQDAAGKTVAQIPNISVGQTVQLKTSLETGKYRLVCSLPGHGEAGMVGTLTVAP